MLESVTSSKPRGKFPRLMPKLVLCKLFIKGNTLPIPRWSWRTLPACQSPGRWCARRGRTSPGTRPSSPCLSTSPRASQGRGDRWCGSGDGDIFGFGGVVCYGDWACQEAEERPRCGDQDILVLRPHESTAMGRERYPLVGATNPLLLQTCLHCGEEFCRGECLRFHYEQSQVGEKGHTV